MSCAKDNRTLLWDLFSLKPVYELPPGAGAEVPVRFFSNTSYIVYRYMFVAARMWDCCVSGRAFAGDTRERRRRPAAGGRRQLWCAYCSILWDVCDGGTITVCFFYEKQLLCSAKDAPQAVTLPPRSSGRGEGPKSPPRLSPTRSPARAFPSFCRDVSPPNYLTTFSFRFRFPSPPPPQMN